jgi:UDP-N-acetyl-D-galactosamine dehydrogenase
MNDPKKIAVLGLGYVGLPLAVALARHYPLVGFDLKAARVAELRAGEDRTREVEASELKATSAVFSADVETLAGCDLFIVTVPTPVSAGNAPDLRAVEAACRTIAAHLRTGGVVVLESTVYPGVTEEICGPILEAGSGLKCGQDFFLGYSPERMNPGDKKHTLATLTKVVAGQTPAVAAMLGRVYGAVTNGNIFLAKDIKTAEAAKVIENAQRDINIAFVNEITMIFNKMGLSAHDVLEAAGTKWNFLPFTPGLVGGHCIGVDPYYLAHKAQAIGHHPEVVLAGRRINDAMGAYVGAQVDARVKGPGRILVLGLTFKENVPDLRNTRVVDVVAELRARGHTVDIHDPLADPAEAKEEYGFDLVPSLAGAPPYDAVVAAVAHADYRAMDAAAVAALLTRDGLVADIKGVWRDLALPDGIRRWGL